MTAAGYVGIEPEAAEWLASALERASAEAADAARKVQALLEEAGEGAVAWPELLELGRWTSFQSDDIRRRARMAPFAAIHAVKACAAPSTHPLARAARAVWANATQLFDGAFDASAETVGSVWQLVPGVDGWTQAWAGIPMGLVAAVQNPGAALDAASGYERWEREGFAYWAGGLIPDLASFLVAGAGAAKTTVMVADTAGDLADSAAVAVAARRLTVTPLDPHDLGQLSWREQVNKARVERYDAEAGGHAAGKHGPPTTHEQHVLRATTGVAPDGTRGRPYDSSRFFTWEDQAAALDRAVGMYTGGRDPVPVRFDHIIGEGYVTKTLEYRTSSVALVRFDKAGRPFTAYPYLDAEP